jgi:hypothetical protein
MKTKIRTLIAICLLGFIGIININAIADNKKVVTAEVVTEKEEMLTNESLMADEIFLKSAEELTAKDVDAQIEKYATNLIFLEESENAGSDVLKEAELFTRRVVDQEEAKLVQKLNAKSAELIEAELFTKWVVDQEEAKLVQKFIPQVEAQNRK